MLSLGTVDALSAYGTLHQNGRIVHIIYWFSALCESLDRLFYELASAWTSGTTGGRRKRL